MPVQPSPKPPRRRGVAGFSLLWIALMVVAIVFYFRPQAATSPSENANTLIADTGGGREPAAAAQDDSAAAERKKKTPTVTPQAGAKTTVTPQAGAKATATRKATATVQPTKTPRPTATATQVAVPRTIDGVPTIHYDDLPDQAKDTIDLIDQGGPFPYDRDGITFQNREGILPSRPRGYYREYTVITPGAGNRGARRIIAGDDDEFYYTDDHYESFSRVVFS